MKNKLLPVILLDSDQAVISGLCYGNLDISTINIFSYLSTATPPFPHHNFWLTFCNGGVQSPTFQITLYRVVWQHP